MNGSKIDIKTKHGNFTVNIMFTVATATDEDYTMLSISHGGKTAYQVYCGELPIANFRNFELALDYFRNCI